MEHLVNQYPSDEDLKTFPFPIPMLLEVRKEAPQYFEVDDNSLKANQRSKIALLT